jgi:hypothetical protein
LPRSRRKNRVPTVPVTSNLAASDQPFNAETSIDIVDNPYRPGETITVTRTLRNDPLAGLHARDVIDEAQYQAGRRWQATYEACTIGAMIAIDPLREPVDGGGSRSVDFSALQLDAYNELTRSRELLGEVGYLIVRDVLGDGLKIESVASRRGFHSEAATKYFGRRFRECLETLTIFFGLASRSPHQKNRPP